MDTPAAGPGLDLARSVGCKGAPDVAWSVACRGGPAVVSIRQAARRPACAAAAGMPRAACSAAMQLASIRASSSESTW